MIKKVLPLVRWAIGAFLALLAFGAIGTGDTLASVPMLALAFLATPLSNKYLFSKLKFAVPIWGKVLLGVFLLFVFGATLTPSETKSEPEVIEVVANAEDSSESTEPEIIYYEVTSVTDGDTIKVLINDKTETIRLVNMNTPETVDPRRPVECMGKEASERMSQLVTSKKISLEIDETQTDRDRYDRLLRFVFLEDGTDVGLEMIRQGYAESSPYGNSPHKYLEEYKAAQSLAQEQKIGLWNPEICPAPTPTPSPTPKSSTQPTIQNSGSGGGTTGATSPTTQPASSGVVKKSTNDICHAPGTTYYDKTTNFTAYNSIDECLASGGRLPKR
jgi:micrococcal nuclease